MKAVYKADLVKAVPARWQEQYKNHGHDSNKQQITERLMALKWPFTAEQVNSIIGNNSWTEFKCDECGEDFPILVRVGAEPDYDARWLDLCKTCIHKALHT